MVIGFTLLILLCLMSHLMSKGSDVHLLILVNLDLVGLRNELTRLALALQLVLFNTDIHHPADHFEVSLDQVEVVFGELVDLEEVRVHDLESVQMLRGVHHLVFDVSQAVDVFFHCGHWIYLLLLLQFWLVIIAALFLPLIIFILDRLLMDGLWLYSDPLLDQEVGHFLHVLVRVRHGSVGLRSIQWLVEDGEVNDMSGPLLQAERLVEMDAGQKEQKEGAKL